MSERIDLTQFEPIIGIDWFYENEVLYLNERKFRYAIYEATDLADINEDLWEEHEQELEELNASFTNAIQDLPNLIAELKKMYAREDELLGALRIIRDDLNEGMAQGHLPIESTHGVSARKIRNFANDAFESFKRRESND